MVYRGKRKDNFGTDVDGAPDLDGAAVRLENPPRDREPQSTGRRSDVVAAVEAIEDTGEILGRNADAAVGEDDLHAASVHPSDDRQLVDSRRVLHRVVDE